MRVRRLAAAGAAALLLPFAACSDGDSNAEPAEPTSSTSSAASSPSETASDGPTLPPEAQGSDEAAAKAFVKFYFELISDAMVTGDTAALRSFSRPTCKSCQSIASLIDDTYSKGGRYTTKGWTVAKVRSLAWHGDRQAFVLETRQHPRILWNRDGERVDRQPVEITVLRAVLLRGDSSWLMDRLDVIT